ncbi:hypothetical protein BU24DRAFT_435682 [Aaosphaeria arxii CBS 175.79]|uniref:Transcription factor TFIIIC triple barrel domain-containing protein n=1 Tax=Aaosphaeria arxii CBS 175.79 TaxID=1450172 RepID=A0A6A5XH89_9PLEO|nr:uncharacterized protein BU24DRAFT_435682 [Aaosphaeria arxii CBS 175.79]KAF2012313.1 hypothetical protein BU24DRAFT_435682 [Aaosphaeria arxii CBS 175.79]
MSVEQEDEWEYEYDAEDTEDFYVTLDLSNIHSNTGAKNMAQHAPVGNPQSLGNRLRVSNTHTGDGSTPEHPTEPSSIDPVGEIQITDIHTQTPLMMYNGQLLSCHWASTIGTDLFFARPNDNGLPSEGPLRSLPSVDLVGIGSAKLMAKAARLQPRDELLERPQDKGEVQHNEPSVTSSPSPGKPKAPSNFLTRLNEAKAKRGEKTRLVILDNPQGSRLSAQQASGPVKPSSRTSGDVVTDSSTTTVMGDAH